MKKVELVSSLAKKAEISESEASKTLNALIEVIYESLEKGEEVNITGFGKFEARERAARAVRNPKTGEYIDVPATVIPGFRPGSVFKEKLA